MLSRWGVQYGSSLNLVLLNISNSYNTPITNISWNWICRLKTTIDILGSEFVHFSEWTQYGDIFLDSIQASFGCNQDLLSLPQVLGDDKKWQFATTLGITLKQIVYLVQVNPDTANKIFDILKSNVFFVGVLQQRMPTADKHKSVSNKKLRRLVIIRMLARALARKYIPGLTNILH